MKRTKLLCAGLAVGVLAMVAALVQAQVGTSTVPTSGGTRVAIVNVGAVFQKYAKAKFYKAELDKFLAPKKAEAEQLKAQMIQWKNKMNEPGFAKEQKEQYEQGILANQRKLEDMDRWVRANVGKIQETQIVTLFKDLSDATQRYASANGIQLVLAYGDTTEDRYNIFNINRVMNGMDLGSTTPLFYSPTVDITQPIIQTLNQNAPQAGTAPGGTITPVSAPGR